MNDKVIIVKGIAGLGNRLRCVASALEYAEKTDRSIYVDWNDGMFLPEGVNAFEEYFKIFNFNSFDRNEDLEIETFYPEVYEKLPMNNSIYNYFEKKQLKNRFIRKGVHYFFKVGHRFGVKNIKIDDLICRLSQLYQCFALKENLQEEYKTSGKFAFGAHLSRNIKADAIIYCDNIPFYKKDTMKNHIKLKKDIEIQVNDFVANNKIDNNTVGVHVRASGKKCYGNIDRFILKLENFVKDNNLEKIFLCTDNLKIEEKFKKHFKDKIITQEKFIPNIKSNETGIHDFAMNSKNAPLQKQLTEEAIIDMFALSKVNYLFYQFGSTFSEISCVYHNDSSKCKSWMSL